MRASRKMQETTEPVTLSAPLSSLSCTPTNTPRGRLFAVTAVSLFWNGCITAVLLWQVSPPPPDLFLLLCAPIGLLFIVGMGYRFLALFNPRPALVVSPRTVPLGGSLNVTWQLSGGLRRMQRLRVTLEGREEVTYRHSEGSYTDKKKFASLGIVDTTTLEVIQAGRGTVSVPANLKPSFESQIDSTLDKIVWALRVHGDIPFWPDVDEEFKIWVTPLRRGPTAPAGSTTSTSWGRPT